MLQKMSAAKAVETKTRNYLSVQKCGDCGSYEKWLDGWVAYKAYCAVCIPETTTVVSKSTVALNEKQRNKRVVRTIKNSVSRLPVVFLGMNNK